MNKEYVDEYFVKRDGSSMMYGDLDMVNHKIENVGPPAENKDVANEIYVNQLQAPFLPLAGRSMAGGIDMHDNTLANLKDPVAPSSGTTKKYVDATSRGRLRPTREPLQVFDGRY